jgi:hypothetical protein
MATWWRLCRRWLAARNYADSKIDYADRDIRRLRRLRRFGWGGHSRDHPVIITTSSSCSRPPGHYHGQFVILTTTGALSRPIGHSRHQSVIITASSSFSRPQGLYHDQFVILAAIHYHDRLVILTNSRLFSRPAGHSHDQSFILRPTRGLSRRGHWHARDLADTSGVTGCSRDLPAACRNL